MERLSILIPAYRRHPMTVRHVAECLKVSRLPDEIIVVNDGGTPDLREMLLELKPFPAKVIYARVSEDILWNYNGACNLGFWISTGDVIVLEDTDHIPSKDAYKNALFILKERPEIDRVGFKRRVVKIEEMSKPIEEWQHIKTWGSNQMVTAFRRDMYIKLKGQDERFCGNYGYMAMSWKDRYHNILKVKSATADFYWALVGDEGEPGLVRGMSKANRYWYKETSKQGHPQHPKGILNFTYTYEIL